MKIVQLQYFCAVTRLHSITKAAAELYVTQPAISSAIKELEKEFSINLFNRTKNHLTLTKEGEEFAVKILNKHESLRDFFENVLGLSQSEASENACRMEHVVSETFFNNFIKFSDFLRENPEFIAKYRKSVEISKNDCK